MKFEDIVDMEWLDSHTTADTCTSVKEESMLSSENSASACQTYDASSSNMAVDITYPENTPVTSVIQQDQKPGMLNPSIDQIKLLIEFAKIQLALQQQQRMSKVEPPPEVKPSPNKLGDFLQSAAPNLSLFYSEVASSQPDTISPCSLIKSDHKPSSHRESISSDSEDGLMSLESYAETGGIDIKKLTSKERRQLRNKISARNFRVRRKEYITTLEAQVDDHKKYNGVLLNRLNTLEEENKQLKLQMDILQRQNQTLQKQQTSMSNLNKDISLLGSTSTELYRQDAPILVS